METTRHRPISLANEAQELSPAVLSEQRLLASARLDSRPLLCVVLAGDARLIEKLRREDLIPLGSGIRNIPLSDSYKLNTPTPSTSWPTGFLLADGKRCYPAHSRSQSSRLANKSRYSRVSLWPGSR